MDSRSDVSKVEVGETRTAFADARLVHFALIGIFLLAFVYALYFARDFFMPVLLAFLMALTLSPVVRLLAKRGVPAFASATLLVLVTFVAVGVTGYLLSGPVVELVSNLPSIGRAVTERLSEIRRPFDHLLSVFRQVDRMTEVVEEPGISRVVLAQPGVVSQAAGTLLSAGTSLAIVFVLSLFLLASGTMFYEKVIQSFATLSQKKRALRIMYDVEREISRYLLTITLINVGLGLAVGLGLWALGMPNPLLWGVAAGLLNFLPYIGAVLSVVAVAAIALVSFDSLSYALVPPAYVLLCNIVEGNVVTPFVVGRRLELNAVAIFIAVAFWSWLWGFVGALIAVPLLVAVKVFCDHFESLNNVGNFLSAQQPMVEEPDTPEDAS
jgi:predicted PurR-regulated permease PerM